MDNGVSQTQLTIRQGAKVDFGGSVRSMGYRKEMSMPSPVEEKKTNSDKCEAQCRSGNVARRELET